MAQSHASRPTPEAPPLPPLSAFPLADVLRLIRTPQVGAVTFFQLLKRTGSPAEALALLPELSLRGGRKEPLKPCAQAEAEREIALTQKFGARFIVYGAPDYPHALLHIADPPPVLTALGDAGLWRRPCVGMVGARNASAAGCSLAQKLARELAASGVTIVSGLARGIDAFAHKGALPSTVGVIGGGIDTVYPPENAALYKDMRERGAILSEQAFGNVPFPAAFPARNRIIAGMSQATLVVEASPKSGSLITARLALEQGREVMAVPGSPLDPRSRGGNQLLKQGALLVEDAQDVLDALAALSRQRVEERPPALYAVQDMRLTEPEIDRARAALLSALSVTPVPMDEVIAQCCLPVPLALAALLELELAGKAVRTPGNRVGLRAE